MDRGVGPSKIDEQLKKTFVENPEAAYHIQMELIRIFISRVRSKNFHMNKISKTLKKKFTISKYINLFQSHNLLNNRGWFENKDRVLKIYSYIYLFLNKKVN